MTPAMASEPYTADAPPVTISTDSMSAGGITFRSETPSSLGSHEAPPVDQHQRARAAEAAEVRRGGFLRITPKLVTTCSV